MGRMSELSIEIQDRLAEGQTPSEVARALGIPTHWVTEISEEDEYQDYLAYANRCADADAIEYGTR